MHGAVRYAIYAVTITKLELLRTNVIHMYVHTYVYPIMKNEEVCLSCIG